MNDVEQHLLGQSGLEEAHIEATLANIASNNIDYADLYFQAAQNESWVLEDGIIKDGSFNIERGVGVRAVTGEKTGFAYSDDIHLDSLTTAANAAKGIAVAGKNLSLNAWQRREGSGIYLPSQPLESLANEQKLALLREAEAYIKQQEPNASQVIISLSGTYEEILVTATDGTWATDIRPMVRFNCTVLLEKDGKRERGSAGGGGRTDYSYFSEEVDGRKRILAYADEAIRQARVNIEAKDAPAGTMPVVLGNGWPGVLLHEAVGHGLEGDFNRKGASAFSGKVGEQVASSLCTIVDNGTIANGRGSLNIDDEGHPSQNNVLIENGILKGYMQDKLNARLMGVAPTGNGRRESYAHLPMPRMTNTYMLPGESELEEMIASIDRGIYAPHFGGGQVDITSGKFVFSASEAYLIENGKIAYPIKGATLIGNGPEAMNKVSMVGNDLAIDPGIGVCGKDGQSVPVGVGQPSLKVDELTVGGTA